MHCKTPECTNPVHISKRQLCKACYSRWWRQSNPERVRSYAGRPGHYRRSRLRAYGLTVDDFDRMATEQGHRCPICDETPPRLVVDHDHKTGQIRGLLCDSCNKALGFLRDDHTRLKRALKYLGGESTAQKV